MATVKKLKLGPVPAPKPDRHLFSRVLEHFAQKELVGTAGDEAYLQSKEGKAALARARTATEAALGFTEEEAEDKSEVRDLAREMRWKREEAAREASKSGADEMVNCSGPSICG